MRITVITLTCLFISTTAVSAWAQDKNVEKQMDPQAMMEIYKKLATPGEPHRLFANLAGSWTTKTKSWMEPDTPPWNPLAPQK